MTESLLSTPAAPVAGAPNAPATTEPAVATPAVVDAPATPPQKFELPQGFDYRTVLPEDIRGEPTFQKYKDIEGLARGTLAAQKMIGKDPSSLVEITENMTDDARRGVLERLGAPADPKAYTLKPVDKAPDFLAPDQPLAGWLTKTAHENRIHPSQMQALYSGFVEQIKTAQIESERGFVAELDRARATLKEEWKGDYEPNLRAARTAVEKLGGDDLRAALEETGAAAHPAVAKALAKIGHMLTEAGGEGDKVSGAGDGPGALAKSKAQELIQKSLDPKMPRAERLRLQQEAQKYFAQASGSKA